MAMAEIAQEQAVILEGSSVPIADGCALLGEKPLLGYCIVIRGTKRTFAGAVRLSQGCATAQHAKQKVILQCMLPQQAPHGTKGKLQSIASRSVLRQGSRASGILRERVWFGR